MPSDGLSARARSEAAALLDPDTDVLLYRGGIDLEGFDAVVRKRPPSPAGNVLLVLSTMGGNIDSAYRIARYLRETYQHVTALVSGMCKSAGTLICIGANEVVIGDTGELGPLDVQVREPDELFSYTSGLAIPQALAFLEGSMLNAVRAVLLDVSGGGGLSVERAAEIAVRTASGAFAPIYAQINPARLGEDARFQEVALEYAERLVGGAMNREGLAALVYGYASHSFVIDREEARGLLGNVREPTESESKLAFMLGVSSPLPVASRPCTISYIEASSSDGVEGGTSDGSRVDTQETD